MATSAVSLRDLRAMLGTQFPDAIPAPRQEIEAAPTGIAALDQILPNGGFPRGRLSVWTPTGGATAVLRAACLAAIARGERAAWIDGAGTIAGPFWIDGPILVRPQTRVHALRAAEALLRSGGFALVAVTGVEPEGTENVRLSRAAHEGGSAVVALTTNASTAGLKVSSRLEPDEYVWRRDPFGDYAAVTSVTMHARVTSLGWNRRARVVLPVIRHEMRSALDADLPDRRGAASRRLVLRTSV